MSVWYAAPSKRPPEVVEPLLAKWRERVYKIAIMVDAPSAWHVGDTEAYVVMRPAEGSSLTHVAKLFDGPVADLLIAAERYPGYAVAANTLIAEILIKDKDAEFIVCAGDDIEPDPHHTAEEIAQECSDHFVEALNREVNRRFGLSEPFFREPVGARTFGVMQPTGDRWGDAQGPYIDRVAGSPWIGREFARRMYQGQGPYWPEYRHQFVDEELQAVAIKMGVFWQRPDLTQHHAHWGRARAGERMAPSERMPAFLAEANSADHWRKYKGIFEARKAAGFPGHEPIA